MEEIIEYNSDKYYDLAESGKYPKRKIYDVSFKDNKYYIDLSLPGLTEQGIVHQSYTSVDVEVEIGLIETKKYTSKYIFDTNDLSKILKVDAPLNADAHSYECKNNILTINFYRIKKIFSEEYKKKLKTARKEIMEKLENASARVYHLSNHIKSYLDLEDEIEAIENTANKT